MSDVSATTPTTNASSWEYSTSEAIQNHGYLWPALLRQLPNATPSELRVLDAGCGNGAFCKVLAKLGYDVSGCDLSETGIGLARECAPECRFEHLSVYDDFTAAFGGLFDIVLSVEVVEHLYDPDVFLRRVRKSLAPDGTFILTTPFHGYWKNLLIAASGKCDAHYNPLESGGHIKFWSRKTMAALLERNGFRMERFAGAGRLPGLWKSMVVVARPLGDGRVG